MLHFQIYSAYSIHQRYELLAEVFYFPYQGLNAIFIFSFHVLPSQHSSCHSSGWIIFSKLTSTKPWLFELFFPQPLQVPKFKTAISRRTKQAMSLCLPIWWASAPNRGSCAYVATQGSKLNFAFNFVMCVWWVFKQTNKQKFCQSWPQVLDISS